MIFALFNALAVALNGLAGGYASRRLGVALVLAVAAPFSLIVALAALALEAHPLSFGGIVIGLIAGVSGGLGILMSYRALAIGPIGIAGAITACTAVIVATFAGFISQGGVTASRVLAVVLCLVAVALVSHRKRVTTLQLSGFALATGAGVIFGFFQVLMSATNETDGWWPLVMVRTGVTLVAWTFLAHQWEARAKPAVSSVPRWVWMAPLAAGGMDVLGNILLIIALRVEDLAVVAIITSMTPALTAVLGWLVLSEKLSRLQLLGLAVSVAALAVTAL